MRAKDAFEGASILVTGGTGSFGQAFVARALSIPGVRKVAVLSRDELKQAEMKSRLKDERLRWFLGDIRDRSRLSRAFQGMDFVVHAAALKRVDSAEYDPFEYVNTNIIGSQNVIDAAIDSGVRKVVGLSTDKASSPVNLYGATKLTSDRLFVAANNYGHGTGTVFSIVRYGNVLGSRGSVVPLFSSLIAAGEPLPVTDRRMTRFWITLEKAVDFVIDCLADMEGGEMFVPLLPSMKVLDLISAMAVNYPWYEVGIRPGEKLHEEMISPDDACRTRRLGDRFIVEPVIAEWGFRSKGELVPDGFFYRSDSNDVWLSAEQLRADLARQVV
jgi:UDP-N-acetylglucosamine 4,6-dehydratase